MEEAPCHSVAGGLFLSDERVWEKKQYFFYGGYVILGKRC